MNLFIMFNGFKNIILNIEKNNIYVAHLFYEKILFKQKYYFYSRPNDTQVKFYINIDLNIEKF